MKRSLFYVSALALLAACGDAAKPGDATPPESTIEPGKQVCTYTYNEGATEVLWIAYKFTEKTGVKGTFNTVNVAGAREAANPADVITNTSFEIMTNSVNSGDGTRDPKIIEHFFGKMAGGDRITGRVSSVDGTETAGKIAFDLSMNGVDKTVQGEYTVTGDRLEAKVELLLSDWNGDAAIASLNEACKDLHVGPDGTSKLWPDVTVFISTTLNKVCE